MPPRVYQLPDGTIVPSVSTVIAQLRSSYTSRQVEEGKELGSAAHALVERAFAGEAIDVEEIPAEVAPAFAAFRAWQFDRSVEVERLPDGRPASELSMISPPSMGGLLAFGGTADMVVRIGSRRVIVDVKTRSLRDGDKLPTPDRHALTQTGAYGLLWEMTYPDRPLTGGLLLMLGRQEPATYRECWMTRPQLECRMREFLALRAALGEHEAGKVELKDTRKADRKAAKAGRAA
jgi:hypothetical protein